jgi:sugar lactone lactonase YvrE
VRILPGGPLRSTSAKTLVGVHSGLRFAKSPRWTGQKLLFLDIYDRSVKSVDMKGTVRTVRVLPYLPAGFGILAHGEMVVGDAWNRNIYRWTTAGSKQIADLSDIAGSCLSEVVIDSRGGIYVGDTGFDFLDPLVDPLPNGVIVHIDADGRSSVVAMDLFFPNGMIITPDNKTLIVAEAMGHRLIAFEIGNDSSLQKQRVWAQLEDDINPDGICLDCEGAIWVAGAGKQALRVKEGGEVDQRITTRRPVFAVMLGGPERKHLFMCTADSNDPVITSRASSATIDIAEVETPGVQAEGVGPAQPADQS